MHNQLIVAVVLLVLSGMTDMVDGLIARKLNQVTELGKMLDPLADKLTQGVVALCLAIKFPVICPVLLVFIAKELLMLCCAVVLSEKAEAALRGQVVRQSGHSAVLHFRGSHCGDGRLLPCKRSGL